SGKTTCRAHIHNGAAWPRGSRHRVCERMSNDWNLIELGDLGVLRLRGPDSVRFLQGQVSSDVERLTPERSVLAGYHNPQGRAIAVLRLVQLAPEDLLAVLPREL